MKIGVDVDGVLTHLSEYVKKYFTMYLKENNIPFKYNKAKERFYEQFNVTKDIDTDFWDEWIFHYSKNTVMMNNASKILKKLHNDGHTLTIITSRTHSSEQSEKGERMRASLQKWFNKHDIYFDEIYYSNEIIGKVDLVKKSKIDVMIDDSVRNINEISEHVPVIIFKNPANKKAKGENKIIANSWKDIYKIICEMAKTN